MNDRSKALDVLRQARDLIAERLTQRVLESAEELLDDARGESYQGDIDSLFEQYGSKLSHLNQILNNLPLETAEAEPILPPEKPFGAAGFVASEDYNSRAVDGAPGESDSKADTFATSSAFSAMGVTPAAMVEDTAEVLPPNFRLFVAQVSREDLLAAARTLAALLDVSEARGMQCVRVFHRRWLADAGFLAKAMQLRVEVLSSSYNGALMLLAECFGLVGIEAIGVLQTLRSRLLQPLV